MSPLGLNFLAILFKSLSVKLLLYFNSFPRVATLLIKDPVPPITPVSNAPSVPNFNLFNKTSVAASLPSKPEISLRSVGPPSKSPIVPKFSASATKTPSAAPPAVAPAIYFKVFSFPFNVKAF